MDCNTVMTSHITDGDVTQSTNITPDKLTPPEALSAKSHHTNSVNDDVITRQLTSDDVMSPITVDCVLTDKCLSQTEVSHVTRLQSFVDSLAPVVTGYSVTSQYDRAEQQQQQQPLDLSSKTTVNTRPVAQHVTAHVSSTNELIPSQLATYNTLMKSRDEWIAEWAVLAAASIHNNVVFRTLPVVTSPLRQSVTSPIQCRRQRRRKLRKLRVSTSSETQQSLSPASTVSSRSRDRKHQCVRHCDVISDDVNTSRVIDVTETGRALSWHSSKQNHVTESLSQQQAENVASKHRVESVYIRCEDKTDNSQHPLVSLQNFVTSLIRHHTDVIMTSPLTDAAEDKSRDSTVLSNCLSNNKSLICCNL